MFSSSVSLSLLETAEDLSRQVRLHTLMPFSFREYLKSIRSAKTPDYLLRSGGGKPVIEVGGRDKGLSQFKGVTVGCKLIFAHGGRTDGMFPPLHLLGFL